MNREDLLFKMFPPSFRQRYGHEMWRVYQESYRDILQENGRFAAFQYAFSSGFDFLKVALHEQLTEVQMLKSRPHVLLSLLALAGVTLYSTLQYGYWNARSMNENVGLLRVFNPTSTRTDVTLQPEYVAISKAIEQRFPNATYRIMDNRMDYGAFGGSQKVLSVAVLDPDLDAQVIPQGSLAPASFRPPGSRRDALKLIRRHLARFDQDMAPLKQVLQAQKFDVKTLCIISHFKPMPTRLSYNPRIQPLNAWMGPMSMQYLKAEVWMGKSPVDPQEDAFAFPYQQDQLSLQEARLPSMNELALCNYVPIVTGAGGKSVQSEPFTGPDIFY